MSTTLGRPGRPLLEPFEALIRSLTPTVPWSATAFRREGDPLSGLPPRIGQDIGLSDGPGRAPRGPMPRDLPSQSWPGR